MAKTVELLLLESVDHVGIVGDVVKVRTGFARNFLMPRGLAEAPSQEMIDSLAEKRAVAQKEVAQKRAERESMIERLEGHTIEVEKNANELGLLYGSVTQHEIATLLNEAGFAVRDRDVRLSQTIKRVDSYEILIRPESDLEATVTLVVQGTGQEYLEALEEQKAAEARAAEHEQGGEGETAPAEASDGEGEGEGDGDGDEAKPEAASA